MDLPAERRATGQEMATAATDWLDSLAPTQRPAAFGPSPTAPDDATAGRMNWFYTPTDHGGLALADQRPAQRRLAMRLVAAGLSEAAYGTVATVMGLENVLDRLERWTADWGREHGRDPDSYWLRVFGEPGPLPWGYRFGGHHVSLNYMVVGGAVVSTTPCFIGADPASSPLLGGQALRPLAGVEDLARQLLASLDADQAERAVLLPRAPSDIIGGNRARVGEGNQMMHMNDVALWHGPFVDQRLNDRLVDIDRRAEQASGFDAADHELLALSGRAKGIPGRDLDSAQRAVLRQLLGSYLERAPEAIQTRRYDEPGGLDAVHFAWAGGTATEAGHYYRLQGPNVLIEYDNTQRSANHIHSVWREPEADFGQDVLRRHLTEHHG